MTTMPRRPKLTPKGHQPYQFARAMDILRGRQDGATYAELAKRYGVTPQRVSQIYQQAMRRGGMRWVRENMRG